MKADDISRKDFKDIADKCRHREGTICGKTAWACRDVICPILPLAETKEQAIELCKL